MVQELSRVKAAALSERGQAEEELIKAKNQVRLEEELSNTDQEKVAEVSRVRVELQEQNGRLQAELAAQEALREKVAALERRLKVTASDHREALLDRESENASLREKLRLKEAEIARIREEEVQRASFLQNAVLAYVQGSPLRAMSPPK